MFTFETEMHSQKEDFEMFAVAQNEMANVDILANRRSSGPSAGGFDPGGPVSPDSDPLSRLGLIGAFPPRETN